MALSCRRCCQRRRLITYVGLSEDGARNPAGFQQCVLMEEVLLGRRPTDDDGRRGGIGRSIQTPSIMCGMNCLHELLGKRKVRPNEYVEV